MRAVPLAPTRMARSCRSPSSGASCGTRPRSRRASSLVTGTLGTTPVGPYQLQAAIAAIHDEAPTAEATDWPQILALYEVLERVSPGPVVTLNRAVAVAMVHGPRAGLALLGTIEADDRMTHTHRLDAVRGHLLEMAGEVDAARDAFRRAATRTASLPERRYLTLQAARLDPEASPPRALRARAS